jgi:hypothetical protein
LRQDAIPTKEKGKGGEGGDGAEEGQLREGMTLEEVRQIDLI